MSRPKGPRKKTPIRPGRMTTSFPNLFATKPIKGKFDVPGHGTMDVDVKPGDRMPGELQSYPVIQHLKLMGSVEDANARDGERNVRWKPRARPYGGHPPATAEAAEIPRGIIIPEAVSDALDAAGLNTPEAALAATDKELLAIKGIGKKTLADIRTIAQSMIDTGGGQGPDPEDMTSEVPGPAPTEEDPGTSVPEGF